MAQLSPKTTKHRKPVSSKRPAKSRADSATGTTKTRPTADATPLVASTVRLNPDVREGLELLQRKLGITMNKLMNEGLAMYVSMRTAALENDLQASLAEIKKLRRKDPTFAREFAAIARAEVLHRDEDPVEGMPARNDTGSAVSMVRDLIAARG